MAKIVKSTKAFDDDDVTTNAKKRRKSLASRAARKVGKKHKVLRPAMYVVVGLAEIVGKALKLSGKGVGKAGVWGGRHVKAKVRKDLGYRKWTAAPQKVAGRKWYVRTLDLTCCGHHYKSVEAMNNHLVTKHRGEKRSFKKVKPKVQRGHTTKTAGKVIVRPKVAGGGRHRARHNIPDAKRAMDLIAAYQQEIAAVRKEVEKIMGNEDNGARAALRNAGAAIGGIHVDARTKVTDFYVTLLGLETGMSSLADGISELGIMLRSERGAHIDPALVRPFMDKAVEHVQEAGAQFTRMLASFAELYAAHIKAEQLKQELAKPNMNLAS